MSIQIKIDSVDRTNLIDRNSFTYDQAMTNQIDTVSFVIRRYDSKTFKPSILDEIEIYEDSIKLFGGEIVGVEEAVEGRVQYFKVMAKDYSHDMDKFLIINTYENTTVDAIVGDFVNNWLPSGYSDGGVSVTTPINYIAFNYEQPSKCLQQLAELVGADWYVDENKVIHFFLKNTTVAPFELNDTNGKYDFNSLRISRDIKNIRNVIYVRGGNFKGDFFIEEQKADGETKVFWQGYRYSGIGVKVNGTPKTVGIDNITDPTTKDVLYNFQEKAIKFRDDNAPLNGDTVEISGYPYIPIIIKAKDNVSISEFGEFEFKIIDKSLNNKDGARDRAKAEMTQYAQELNEGNFVTKENGLRVGQRIRVQSNIRGIDEFYHISRISTKMDKPDSFVHNVTLISQKTYGMVEFLQEQLMKKDKEIEINPDEVLDKIEAALETIKFGEVVITLKTHNPQTEQIQFQETAVNANKDLGTIFVYAPFPIPTGVYRQGNFNGAVYGIYP